MSRFQEMRKILHILSLLIRIELYHWCEVDPDGIVRDFHVLKTESIFSLLKQ